MSLDRERLKALEAALVALTAPSKIVLPPLVDGPPAPEEPTVVLPLRVALEAQGALWGLANQLEAAAKVATGDSNDVAGAWMRASDAASALEVLRPLVEAARQENRRRWAEHKAEWDRLRRQAREAA